MKHLLVVLLAILIYSCTESKSSTIKPAPAPKTGGVLIKITPQELLKTIKYDPNMFLVYVEDKSHERRACKRLHNYHYILGERILENPDTLPKNRSIILLSENGKPAENISKFLSEKGYTVYWLYEGMDAYWKWRESIIRDQLKMYDNEIDVIELYADDFGC